ncbi:MAG: hypothetical protein FWE25_03045 [Lachnospiraceae bacterium]|nr:hypothetical protein [Lachnospiraceae bacterium]
MKKRRKQCLSFAMTIVLVLGLFAGLSMTTLANNTGIVAQVSNQGAGYQAFGLTTHVAGEAIIIYPDNTEVSYQVQAGYHYIIERSDAKLRMEFWEGSYDSWKIGNVYIPATWSSGEYMVPVYFQDERGNDLMEPDFTNVVLGPDTYNSEFTYEVPQFITSPDGGTIYQCVGNKVVIQYPASSYVFKYTSTKLQPINVTVNFVDMQNNILDSEVVTVGVNEILDYTAPGLVAKTNSTTGEEEYYVFAGQSPTASFDYLNAPASFNFTYILEPETLDEGYLVKVDLMHPDGGVLMTLSQTVHDDSTGIFHLPLTYHMGSMVFALKDAEQYRVADSDDYVLNHGYKAAERHYEIAYELAEENAPYTVYLYLMDSVTGERIRTIPAVARADGGPVTFDLADSDLTSFDLDDMRYTLIAGQGNNGLITHQYGDAARTYEIYYRSNTIGEAGAKEITLRYIDVSNNLVLEEHAQVVTVGGSITFDIPSELHNAYTGSDYVLLNGQGPIITHNYHDTRTEYAVYYRDVNDVQYMDVDVIDEVITQYVFLEGDETVTTEFVEIDGEEIIETEYVTVDGGEVVVNETVVTDGGEIIDYVTIDDDGVAVPTIIPISVLVDEEVGVDEIRTADGTPAEIDDNNAVIADEDVPLAADLDRDGLTANANLPDENVPSSAFHNGGFLSTTYGRAIMVGVTLLTLGLVVLLILRRRREEREKQDK